ncbi:acyltransferase family protein [Jidongwangia harbinensis]|uniref:acyltransferase family protein n=1 Tax=Jidongwangia harbinensis TaxID=2878561 RepID=UPI002342DF63|nr:acyltransferase [Jidongwangia harbinensis]
MLPSASTATPVPRTRRSVPGSDTAPRSGPAPAVPRMGWLDALRGLAALVVVFYHFADHLLGGVLRLFDGWLWTGRYGVMLFFLVSGYVIPMSLERYGNLRRFWLGRLFRIYPAWLLAVVLAGVAIAVLDHRRMPAALTADPVAGALAHLTMLQELLGLPNLLGVFWTLSYEMVFYLFMSALFVFGLHRRPAVFAIGIAAAALAGGWNLPDGAFTARGPGPLVTTVLVTAVVIGSVLAYLSGRRTAAVVAAGAGLGIIALPALNGAAVAASHASGSWQALTFLAIMFCGSVIHAAQHGRLRRRAAAAALATAAACLLLSAWWNTPRPGQSAEAADRARTVAIGTLLAVAVTFAIGYAWRHRRVPDWAAWLGRISYSVYLLHPLLLWILDPYLDEARRLAVPVKLLIAVGYLSIVLIGSSLAYRWVELPGQALGKRVGRAVERRWSLAGRHAASEGRRAAPVERRPASAEQGGDSEERGAGRDGEWVGEQRLSGEVPDRRPGAEAGRRAADVRGTGARVAGRSGDRWLVADAAEGPRGGGRAGAPWPGSGGSGGSGGSDGSGGSGGSGGSRVLNRQGEAEPPVKPRTPEPDSAPPTHG